MIRSPGPDGDDLASGSLAFHLVPKDGPERRQGRADAVELAFFDRQGDLGVARVAGDQFDVGAERRRQDADARVRRGGGAANDPFPAGDGIADTADARIRPRRAGGWFPTRSPEPVELRGVKLHTRVL